MIKRLAKALISLRVCAGWSEPLLVAHTTLLEISYHGLYYVVASDTCRYAKKLYRRPETLTCLVLPSNHIHILRGEFRYLSLGEVGILSMAAPLLRKHSSIIQNIRQLLRFKRVPVVKDYQTSRNNIRIQSHRVCAIVEVSR